MSKLRLYDWQWTLIIGIAIGLSAPVKYLWERLLIILANIAINLLLHYIWEKPATAPTNQKES